MSFAENIDNWYNDDSAAALKEINRALTKLARQEQFEFHPFSTAGIAAAKKEATDSSVTICDIAMSFIEFSSFNQFWNYAELYWVVDEDELNELGIDPDSVDWDDQRSIAKLIYEKIDANKWVSVGGYELTKLSNNHILVYDDDDEVYWSEDELAELIKVPEKYRKE